MSTPALSIVTKIRNNPYVQGYKEGKTKYDNSRQKYYVVTF